MNKTKQIPLTHRCQTLARGPNVARSVIIFGPQADIKSLLVLARHYYTAHELLMLQIPECLCFSASIRAGRSLKDIIT